MEEHKQGDSVEAITYPGYTKATRKRKRKELTDVLDKTLAKGRMAVIDLPNDDSLYHLRFGLVKVTNVSEDRLDFQWYTYAGYPKNEDPSYGDKWFVQILAGRGQKIDMGYCHPASVVLTFESLTRGKTIPNVGRLAPLKLISRALSGEFGTLPQDEDWSCGDSSDKESSNERDCITYDGPVTRRGKRRAK